MFPLIHGWTAIQRTAPANARLGVVLCFVPLEYLSQLTAYPSIETEVIGDNTRAALIVVRAR